MKYLLNKEKIIKFVLKRRNEDGGYGFCPPQYGSEFPSSSSDTFYAISILKMLGETIPQKHKTEEYLLNLQNEKGSFSSMTSAFYVVKALELLGSKPRELHFLSWLESYLKKKKLVKGEVVSDFLSAEYDVSSSPYKYTYCIVEILKTFGRKITTSEVEWILPEGKHGGFGVGSSDIISTFYALSCLHAANYPLNKLEKTKKFVEGCEHREGGFTSIPHITPPYIEDTYFGIECAKLLGIKLKHPERTERFIVSCQNIDGGFRRSIFQGISTLDNTYFALASLKTLA
ncbi:MAG: prenyltransferase/squalene oxidase repeat-containing protein [Candidatus Micrarchaeia archaeon]